MKLHRMRRYGIRIEERAETHSPQGTRYIQRGIENSGRITVRERRSKKGNLMLQNGNTNGNLLLPNGDISDIIYAKIMIDIACWRCRI